jgi:DNA-binding NarL/FixJ family response regulator
MGLPRSTFYDVPAIHDITEAMSRGVRGYITTDMELLETAAVIQCAAAGGSFVPVSALIKSAKNQPNEPGSAVGEGNEPPFERLTRRESEVVARLSQGKSNKVIARELAIKESTVKVFVRRILSKLHASNRTEVALLACAHSAGRERINQIQDCETQY